MSGLLSSEAALLLVQLLGPLLELLLARRLAEVVGDDRAGVGLVVIEGRGASARGLVVGIVEGVGRSVGVAGLLRDLVGQVCKVEGRSVICFSWAGSGAGGGGAYCRWLLLPWGERAWWLL